MEKYQNFDDAILGLQNEVNKYSINNINLSSSLIDSPIRNEEINILSSKSIPKIVLNPMILLQHAIQTLIQSVVKSLSFYYFYYDVK